MDRFVSPAAKAWVAFVALLATVAVQAILVELPLSATAEGWLRVAAAVLGVGLGTLGVYQVENRPAPLPPRS